MEVAAALCGLLAIGFLLDALSGSDADENADGGHPPYEPPDHPQPPADPLPLPPVDPLPGDPTPPADPPADPTPGDPRPSGEFGQTDGDDQIDGTELEDVIRALMGNDAVNAGDGADYVEGNEGDDTLDGQGGDDEVLGGEGDDVAYGEGGNDTVDGGPGADQVYGDWGDDHVLGGDGDDEVKGGAGNDIVDGQGGGDDVHGGLGEDTIFGGEGDDILVGVITDTPDDPDLDGADTLFGDAGDDWLVLGNGDEGTGGDGADTFVLGTWTDATAPIIADYVAGEDQILIEYDDVAAPAPVVTIDTVSDGANDYAAISIDGQVVGRVLTMPGAPPLAVSDIGLVPIS